LKTRRGMIGCADRGRWLLPISLSPDRLQHAAGVFSFFEKADFPTLPFIFCVPGGGIGPVG